MRNLFIGSALVALLAAQPDAQAADLYVYPAQGQTPEQQTQDEAACYQFARQQTGFDPMAAPTATSAQPQQQGSVVGGAARGALVGAAVGAIAGDAGEGAAMGAAAGGLMGGMRRNSTRRQQDDWQQQQQQAYQANRNEYNRAYGACLEGRGYTVR